MIDEISVQNLALIRDGSLRLSSGLTVLTGETGAGKTALLSALKLLMGARASADLVRDGEDSLTVSGRFFGLPQGAAGEGDVSDESDASGEGEGRGNASGQDHAKVGDICNYDASDNYDETVVTRTVSSDGRSRVTINGAMAAVRELTQSVAPSIDLCGQFEHQQLMSAANHRALLDAWAYESIEEPLQNYQAAFECARTAAAALQAVNDSQQLSSAKLDEARFALKRIEEIDPQPGEYDSLLRDLKIAENSEALATAVARTREALNGDGGALDKLNEAAAALESVAGVDDSLANAAQVLRQATFEVEDAAMVSRHYGDSLEFDAETLAAQQERLASLQGLMRTYGPTMEAVLERKSQAEALVAMVDDFDFALQQAQKASDEAEAALAQAADTLDDARNSAAPAFVKAVSSVMATLAMGGATLACDSQRLAREHWTESSPSSWEFLYSPVADARPRPLNRIASGGEVSRVMLALKVVLGAVDNVDTLVFDEVDAGVGGAVALALADVLASLARTHQVLMVTHLPQVAVQADTHYVVSREGDATTIAPVTGKDRQREIARMLAGSITKTSLAHAQELLDSV